MSKNKTKETTKAAETTVKYPETITIKVGDVPIVSELREFSTGSWGYNLTSKILVEGHKCQLSGNLIIVGSNPNKKKPE